MVDIKTVDKIANLARLEIDESEKEGMIHELNRVLDYVTQLQKIDTTGVAATAFVESERDALRDDVVKGSFSPDDALINAPKSSQGHFAVPKVIG